MKTVDLVVSRTQRAVVRIALDEDQDEDLLLLSKYKLIANEAVSQLNPEWVSDEDEGCLVDEVHGPIDLDDYYGPSLKCFDASKLFADEHKRIQEEFKRKTSKQNEEAQK